MTQPSPPPPDPMALTADLIRCASVTPDDAGALGLLADILSDAGFDCHRIDRGGVGNLFARWGAAAHRRSFGFNGHVDVVPPGDVASWTHPPFAAAIADGQIWGRGAADMKSGVAAFVAAAVALVREAPPEGAIVITITADEEGVATDGTAAILDWMAEQGEQMTACLVGEPTCPETLGDMIKIGRRGSLTARVLARGVQGHAAYPHRARNPLSALVRYLARLEARPIDSGTAHFDPSTLAITTIDCGNPATNVIPSDARATMNIRFNELHSSADIAAWLKQEAEAVTAATGVAFEITTGCSGESFLTAPGPFTDLVVGAIAAETGIAPALSTSGGTSDARFIARHCPVVEFGIVGATMHQTDERVRVADIAALSRVYRRIMADWFAADGPA
jgi:succinyl-diaminopimelate desuccinylase